MTELQRELEKLRVDLDRLVALIPNVIVRNLVAAVVARFTNILHQLIGEK